MDVAALGELSDAGEKTCCDMRRYKRFTTDLVTVSLGCSFEPQIVPLARDDVGAVISEPDRRRQTSTPVPFPSRNGFTDRKDLPITLEAQTELLEP